MPVNAQRATQFLGQFPNRYVSRLFAVMQKIGFDLQGYIQRNKLQGQVLNHRSGWLSSHVHSTTTQVGPKVTTIVGVDGNAVPYAAIHEYGGKIHIPEVINKLMVFESGGETVFTMRHKAFTVNMPERSYMRSSLKERRDLYIGWIRGLVHASA